jgi:hypothetical protein
VFVLSEILHHRKESGLETFCCFLDIKKAYDTTFREGVWRRLLEVGINGKLWRVIRNLYAVVESCVLLGDTRTDWFAVELGLRQGDPPSPIFYIVFIDGLIREIKKLPVGVVIGDMKVNILAFADDIILLAESRKDMQCLLDRVISTAEIGDFSFMLIKVSLWSLR